MGELIGTITCDRVIQVVQIEKASNHQNINWMGVADPGTCPGGQMKAALVTDTTDDTNGRDYHWYRQDDNLGIWSHKPGQTATTVLDLSNNLIFNPETANRGRYNNFCGYACVPSYSAQGSGTANVKGPWTSQLPNSEITRINQVVAPEVQLYDLDGMHFNTIELDTIKSKSIVPALKQLHEEWKGKSLQKANLHQSSQSMMAEWGIGSIVVDTKGLIFDNDTTLQFKEDFVVIGDRNTGSQFTYWNPHAHIIRKFLNEEPLKREQMFKDEFYTAELNSPVQPIDTGKNQSGLEVSLIMHSGRPNPTFKVDSNSKELKSAIASLGKIITAMVRHSKVGDQSAEFMPPRLDYVGVRIIDHDGVIFGAKHQALIRGERVRLWNTESKSVAKFSHKFIDLESQIWQEAERLGLVQENAHRGLNSIPVYLD